MNLKVWNEIVIATSFDVLMDEDVSVVLKLTCLVSNIKREIVGS
jgi:hypothetical protein